MDFTTKATRAEFWFTQTAQMFAASEALFVAMTDRESKAEASAGYHKGSMFLLGIALENAFKGVVAAQGQMKVTSGLIKTHKSFPGCKNHNLVHLAKLIEFSLSETELELLERLSIYTVWAGKYGTPLSETDYLDAQGRQVQSANDFEIAKKLILKLRAMTDFDEVVGWPKL